MVRYVIAVDGLTQSEEDTLTEALRVITESLTRIRGTIASAIMAETIESAPPTEGRTDACN